MIKIGVFSALVVTGGSGILKLYKHAAGVGNILEYPHPDLRRKSEPITGIDDQIVALSCKMIGTLRYYAVTGFFSRAFMSRGIAAIQLGIAKRLIVCGIMGELKVLINPEIVETRATYTGFENCLSVPSQGSLKLTRPGVMKLRYRGLDNRQATLTVAGEYAALLAHEIDHLDGVLYIDHI
jgi:peptide deformylase